MKKPIVHHRGETFKNGIRQMLQGGRLNTKDISLKLGHCASWFSGRLKNPKDYRSSIIKKMLKDNSLISYREGKSRYYELGDGSQTTPARPYSHSSTNHSLQEALENFLSAVRTEAEKSLEADMSSLSELKKENERLIAENDLFRDKITALEEQIAHCTKIPDENLVEKYFNFK
jgi:hypothetical protein